MLGRMACRLLGTLGIMIILYAIIGMETIYRNIYSIMSLVGIPTVSMKRMVVCKL